MQLLNVLQSFGKCRVLVIGDLILDCYIWGRVSRISPEAPVPVVDVDRKTYALGGACNVASNIVALGGKASVIGIVGMDRSAEKIRELFNAQGIDFIAVEDRRPTTVKTRVIAHSQQVVRFDQESREKLSGKSLKALIDTVKKEVARHDAVIISDYKKGIVTGEMIKAVVRAAGKKFIALDPKVGHFHLYKGVSMITPNKNEAALGSGVEIADEASLIKAGKALLRKTAGEAVLITRGEEGMSLFRKSGTLTHIPTLAKDVYDVTGAGDTVISVFTMALASGATMEEAAVISNHAAGIVVAQVGTAQPTMAELKQSIKGKSPEIQTKSIR